MKKQIFAILAVVLGVAAYNYLSLPQEEDFDRNGKITRDFELRRHIVGNESYFSFFDSAADGERKQAMQFLYAYMPLPDIADYPAEYHLQNVDYALKARAEMPWGKNVPVREFLHFVLPVRVNNENMDTSRAVFYNELKERVKNLSMHDAVLEVNHWCHEKVTYTPSDIRTSSPLATVRTAYGRCGEESTFTVAALRAVGIPARQVYTPRWAHTDNNHAWVEAWVDGEWHFLGACEPEPVLDLAWFNAPASRGMLMHTNAFGSYDGPEEVLSVTPCFTEINVTSNYAPVATTNIQVTDKNGNPVQATVEFKIYNYAEFNTAATKECDSEGRTSITSGLGDMVAWASKDGLFGFAKFTAGKDKDVTVIIDKAPGYTATLEMNITPPKERNTIPEVTPAQAEENRRRFAYEDSIRNAYVATFPTEDDAAVLAAELGLEKRLYPVLAKLLKQSRGNHAAITEFLKGCPAGGHEKAMALLFSLSEKDRRDVSLEVLNDHLPAALENVDNDCSTVYFNFVVSPRVSNEMLTPYRSFFADAINADEAAAYRENPALWVEWCRNNISVEQEWNPLSLCMSPKGVWEMRVADPHSRDIFFVSAARAMGIPARKDEVTGKVQYRENMHYSSEWIDVDFEAATSENAPQGKVKASFKPSAFVDDPRYYSHFSISKIAGGKLQLLEYPEEGITWSNLLKDGTSLDEGDYLMMTGTRMADGGVLAHLTFFNVEEGKENKLQYVLRESSEKLQVIGDFNSENLFYDTAERRQRSLLSATGRGYYIIALVAPGNEPTNHFLRDVMPYKEEFEKWGQKMVLLFRDSNEAGRFVNDFPQLPESIVWGTDINDNIYNEIVANMKLDKPNRPIILVADTFNRVVFMSQGYSIGLGEQLVKVIKQLSE